MRVMTGIYRGLILGYPAKLAAFVGEKRLDKIEVTSGYYWRFCGFLVQPFGEIYCRIGGGILTS